MQLTLFLQHMEPVIGRDPCVFFEALKATCRVRMQGRAYIGLIPKEVTTLSFHLKPLNMKVQCMPLKKLPVV